MKRRLALLTLPILAATMSLTACTGSSDYAAKVNGHEISTKTILDELHTITSNPRYVAVLEQQLGGLGGGTGLRPAGENTVNAQYTAQLLFNRVLVELIDATAEKEGVVPSPAQIADAEEMVRKDLGDPALFDSLPASYRSYLVDRQAKLTAIVTKRNTPEAQRTYYNQHIEDFTEYCVSHILVNSQTQASQLRKQIVEDGGDFAALARQFSLDNQSTDSSASNGGALGCYKRPDLDQFIAVFRDAALKLPVNEVSQPVESQFGYHLIKVTNKNVITFEQAQNVISQEVGSSSAFLQSALDSASIKVNPRFGVYQKGDERTGQPSGVVPPPVNGPQPRVDFDPNNQLAPQSPTAPDHSDH